MTARVGLLGFGRIGRHVYDCARTSSTLSVEAAYDPGPVDVDESIRVDDVSDLADADLDLVVEAANRTALQSHAVTLLDRTDVLALSSTALADPDFAASVERCCEGSETSLYVPHGAILGTDGLSDAAQAFSSVTIETTKPPENLDFSFTDQFDPTDVEGRTTLYEGSTRGICELFPRNVNSHATVALAGLGFDETRSKLVADPDATDAVHDIAATGDGVEIAVRRRSAIEGVSGSYTLASIWGVVSRLTSDDVGVSVV